jgi:hypothetical protein
MSPAIEGKPTTRPPNRDVAQMRAFHDGGDRMRNGLLPDAST